MSGLDIGHASTALEPSVAALLVIVAVPHIHARPAVALAAVDIVAGSIVLVAFFAVRHTLPVAFAAHSSRTR